MRDCAHVKMMILHKSFKCFHFLRSKKKNLLSRYNFQLRLTVLCLETMLPSCSSCPTVFNFSCTSVATFKQHCDPKACILVLVL